MKRTAASRDNAGDDAKRAKVLDAPKELGDPYVIGTNSVGQLGRGLGCDHRRKPTPLAGSLEGKKALDVCCGGMHTVVLGEDGKVHTFGCNDEAALGRAAKGEDEMTPGVAGGLEGLTIVKVTAGDSHTAVLTTEGDVYMCGLFRDDDGAIAFSDSIERQVTFAKVFPPANGRRYRQPPTAADIASGSNHLMILTDAGKVFTLGNGRQGQLGRLTEPQTQRDSCRVTRDTPEWVVKRRTSSSFLKRILTPQPVPRIKQVTKIFATTWGSYAIDAQNNVWAWGLNNYFQLGIKRDEEQSADVEANCVFHPQKADNIPQGTIVEVAGGQHHTLFLMGDGKVYALGRGESGCLGQGNEQTQSSPVEVKALADKKITSIGAGSVTSYAMAADKAFAWGFGENNQLTAASDEDVLVPMEVTGSRIEGKRLAKIDGGDQHAVMLAV
ncbi:hypothetical protein PTSG_01577 [Salpingoeca rosetta]|uniref:RCC1-like domain-containing protein n=1 Tax=Salpingoeca rosetta (strain ATCC 50818 / BSB-021) TaxID=946362 RepID=F2TYC6_SALR5|nr:uncharacterized protein PTSG_01577 [Salpingoeca rosetta]EGD78600.1 hypothetical protein PTSG_01577 [Salpingoeca rosetta]|eukprot:XP_004997558.1 hypothetical protein PTSG_01577 [Salpingoeca rosetta]